MDSKDRISQISEEIVSLEQEAGELQNKAFNLREERERLIASTIVEDKLLKGSTWELYLPSNNNPVLHYTGPLTGDKVPEGMNFLNKLARGDYHSSIELADGIRLRFDDNDISLSFKESKQVMPFVKKNSLKVNGQGIKDNLAKLKRDVEALEIIVHQFGSIL